MDIEIEGMSNGFVRLRVPGSESVFLDAEETLKLSQKLKVAGDAASVVKWVLVDITAVVPVRA